MVPLALVSGFFRLRFRLGIFPGSRPGWFAFHAGRGDARCRAPLSEGTEPIWLIMLLHLLAFFWIAVVCHRRTRPQQADGDRLTEFYLWLAAAACSAACSTLSWRR